MFESVQLAVELSVKHRKPLLVIISENKNSECWALDVTKQVLQSVGNCGSIPLSIKNSTKDYDDFCAIFPTQSVPCIYLLRDSTVLFKVDKPLSKDKLISLLRNATAEKKKPQAQSSSVINHSKEIQEKKRLDMEERKRILRLVQSDREEQKVKESKHRTVETKELIIPAATQKSGDEVALLIRMFDGSALKNRFKNTDTLMDVRSWIDEHRTDNDHPFTFYQNIPKRWFQPTEETQSLTELALCPSASLILKPASNVSNAYSRKGSWLNLQSIANGLYVFLGIGYRPPCDIEDEEISADVDEEEIASKSDRDSTSHSVSPEPERIIRMRTPLFSPNDDGL